MTAVRLCGMALIVCISGLAIRQIRPDAAKAAAIVGAVIIGGYALTEMIPTVEYLKNLDGSGNYPEYLKLMLKGAGIAIIGETVSDICRECGEQSLGGKIELACRLEIIAISLPVIKSIVETGTSLLNQ